MIEATLESKSWLRRRLAVSTPEGIHAIEYLGRGLGWEGVTLDGVMVARGTSISWWVPRFDFAVGSRDAVVEVRIWPWFTIRSFRFTLGGEVVYQEPA